MNPVFQLTLGTVDEVLAGALDSNDRSTVGVDVDSVPPEFEKSNVSVADTLNKLPEIGLTSCSWGSSNRKATQEGAVDSVGAARNRRR